MTLPLVREPTSNLRADTHLTAIAWLIAIIAIFTHLGSFPLLAPDEGRNAEVAREMAEKGTWLVPTYDGVTYLDKPAFYFRTVALSLAALGDTEFAARLPSALAALGVLWTVFAFCRQVYDRRTAALAVMVVASLPLIMAFSRIVIFDMMLGLFVSGAIFAAYLATVTEGRVADRWYWVAAAAAGLATLVKGPVGFILPFLVMAAFHVSGGEARVIRRFFRPLHWLIFLGLVLPWFLGLSLARPDFPYYGIVKESLARFATTEFRRTQPFYYYGVVVAVGGFAWSLLLPESLVAVWRRRRQLAPADRLFILWGLVVVAFFSLSQSKLPGYILTAMVALGVLTARLFALAWSSPGSTSAGLIRRGTLALFVVAALIAAAVAGLALDPAVFSGWHPASHLERWLPLQPFLPRLALTLGIPALLALWVWRRRDPQLHFLAFLSLPLLLVLNGGLLQAYAGSRSGKALAESVSRLLPQEAELACLGCLPNGLPFYLGRELTVITDSGREFTSNYVLFTLAKNEPWPPRIVPIERLGPWLRSQPQPVFLLAKTEQWPRQAELARELGLVPQSVDTEYRGLLVPPAADRGH